MIYALSGLQEVDKLIAHYRRVHLAHLTQIEALELRALWERRGKEEGG